MLFRSLRRIPQVAGLLLAASAGVAALAACAADSMSDELAGSPYDPGSGVAGSGGSSQEPGFDAGLPPEKEVESSYEYPAATGRYVWVANPISGRVAYINGSTLEVRTTQAGNGPTYLAAVPDTELDTAIVINTASSNATVLRADQEGNIDTKDLPIAQGSNAWAIEGSAQWAIAWTDYRKAPSGQPSTEGFQDIAVLRLVQGEEFSTRLSVGYRPVAFSFSKDASKAYAVTQDGISVIDLLAEGGPIAVKLVALSDDPLQDPGSRDVAVTPDGRYALVRRDQSERLTVVDLEAETRVEVVLPAPVTDLDLSPDGTRAIAVVRDTSQIALLPIPGIATEPDNFVLVGSDGQAVVGSVVIAEEANVALLYSNATQQQRITRMEYSTSSPLIQTLKLHAPVLSVFLSRDGSGALILHNSIQPNEDAGISGSSVPGAFSVLKMEPQLPAKLQVTQAWPTAFAIAASGQHAVVAESRDNPAVYGAYLIKMSTQQVDRYPLASPPIAVGVLGESNRAFIAQKHPEGRVSFLDLGTGEARTLTGFELGARVVDGSEGK